MTTTPDTIRRYWGRATPREFPRFSNEVTGVVDAGEATFRLYGPVDDWGGDWGVSAAEVGQALDLLPEGVETIHVRINSPGGMVFEGLAIKNLLAAHPARIVAHVDGIAASIASVIACAADELVMGPDTQLMIHEASSSAWGPAAALRKAADVLEHLSGTIAAAYARKAGTDVSDWAAAMAAETWYSADQAVEAGLADRVATVAVDDPAATAAFDLTGIRGEQPTEPVPAPVPEPEPLPAAAVHHAGLRHQLAFLR